MPRGDPTEPIDLGLPEDFVIAPARPPVASRRSSLLRARADLTMRLRGEPLTLDPFTLQGLVVTGVDWTRNAPGMADSFAVTFAELPFDERVIAEKSALVSCWLHDGFDTSRLTPGGRGFFQGVITGRLRKDFITGQVTIDGEDMTALLLTRTLVAAEINEIEEAAFASLESLVRRLLSFKDGTEGWELRILTKAADLGLSAAGWAEPPRIKTGVTYRRVKVGGRPLRGPEVDGSYVRVGAGRRSKMVYRAANPATPFRDAGRSTWRQVATYRDPTPAEVLQSRQAFLTSLLVEDLGRAMGGKNDFSTNVWDAICRVCVAFGVVPEVDVGDAGVPRLTLVDAGSLQTSDVLRPFARGDRFYRLLVKGTDIVEMNGELDFEAHDDRPDFVVVSSTDVELGRTLKACWPPGLDIAKAVKRRNKDNALNGLYQTVEGVASVDHLQNLARAAYDSLQHNQFTMTVKVDRPWSSGGGPHDPDLLDLAYGAAVEIDFVRWDDHTRPPSEILQERLRLPAEITERILAAQDRLGALSLHFQVVEVTHSWMGGEAPSYSCEIKLRQALGTDEVPMVGEPPTVPDSIRRTA